MVAIAGGAAREAVMKPDVAERPNSVPWPPLLYLAAIAPAVALEMLVPSAGIVPEGLRRLLRLKGIGLLTLGAGLDIWAMLTMTRARANILPHRAATALVTSGPFRFSRNPIYLGNTIMMIGGAFAFLNFWLIPAGLLAALATHHLAIRREEAHMTAKFGDAWRAYAVRTRRWIGIK
jgi:protein-S-isoprenylcysteine O-methyltransferase Ste14